LSLPIIASISWPWLLGALYFVLMVTLGVMSIRKGHWVMFIIGIFIPLFWVIGGLMPPRKD
jgi:hypothetical protein